MSTVGCCFPGTSFCLHDLVPGVGMGYGATVALLLGQDCFRNQCHQLGIWYAKPVWEKMSNSILSSTFCCCYWNVAGHSRACRCPWHPVSSLPLLGGEALNLAPDIVSIPSKQCNWWLCILQPSFPVKYANWSLEEAFVRNRLILNFPCGFWIA